MGVLNFAHGAFMMAGAYAGWLTMTNLPSACRSVLRLLVAIVVAIALERSSVSSSRSSSCRSTGTTSSRSS